MKREEGGVGCPGNTLMRAKTGKKGLALGEPAGMRKIEEITGNVHFTFFRASAADCGPQGAQIVRGAK